ncbi:MAG: HEAT repeat domain-containing protein [Planctomycetota bacterium]
MFTSPFGATAMLSKPISGHWSFVLTMLLVLGASPALGAQGMGGTDAPPAGTPAAGSSGADLPAIEAPPPLPKVDIPKLERAIPKLRSESADYRAKVEREIIGLGRGALPELAKSAVTKDAFQQEGLVNCLAALADLRDRDFVQSSLTSAVVPLRRFAARKVGDYGRAVPELIEQLLPVLNDADESARTEAALSLLRCGRDEGLRQAALVFDTAWKDRVLAALPGVANQGAHDSAAALLVIDPKREKEDAAGAAKERLAAVQLLATIGDPASQKLLVRALDDKHNLVQRAAINALRRLLEGQGELKTISTFDQIKELERLKKVWAERKPG